MRIAAALAVLLVVALPALADDSALEVPHAQTTYARQWKPSFPSPYAGTNSLTGASAAIT